MAAIASEPCVLSLQPKAGLFVIKRFEIKLDQGKIASIVIGMTARTLLARSWLHAEGRMETAPRCYPLGDFAMTFEAFESRFAPAELVTTGALGSAVKRLMAARQWPGGNLRGSMSQQQPCGTNQC